MPEALHLMKVGEKAGYLCRGILEASLSADCSGLLLSMIQDVGSCNLAGTIRTTT